MNHLLKLKASLILTLFLSSCSTEYIKIYCKKGDPSSVRLISKKNPFLVFQQKKDRETKIATDLVSSAIPKIEISSKRKDEIEAILEKVKAESFLNYTGLHTMIQQRPCDDKAFEVYMKAMESVEKRSNAINETLKEVKTIAEKTIKGNGLGGANSELLYKAVKKLENI